MKFYRSTRGGAAVGAPEAILAGIAPDGGLYTPEEFPAIDLNALSGASALAISSEILYQLLGDFSREEMETIVRQGYAGKFATEELTPLLQVGNQYVLELFYGPTSAFKDVALSILPRLLSASREKMGVREEIVILTATSGDTGKAALEGFRDVPGTRIAVFYPHGGVSDVQYRQMATQEGANVRVCAVRGNFDDAQTGVKRIFAMIGEIAGPRQRKPSSPAPIPSISGGWRRRWPIISRRIWIWCVAARSRWGKRSISRCPPEISGTFWPGGIQHAI